MHYAIKRYCLERAVVFGKNYTCFLTTVQIYIYTYFQMYTKLSLQQLMGP